MKSCIFFILIFFLETIICSKLTNLTDYGDYSVCPVSFFRRKRALMDYTRWQADEDKTREFLVKVLDEDFTTPSNNKIVAINIQPITKGVEKIIVGGAMVPPPTTAVTIDFELLREYTRFILPTEPTSHIDGIYVGTTISPTHTKADFAIRHSDRDESPPASPKFLKRTQSPRQYAPIPPVTFTRHTTLTALTPPAIGMTKLYTLTRTTRLQDVLIPTRTTPFIEYDNHLRNNMIYDADGTLTSNNARPYYTHSASPEKETIAETTDVMYEQRRIFESRPNVPIETTKDKEAEDYYNMMSYIVDDDMESGTKKKGDDSTSNYYEKIKTRHSALTRTTPYENSVSEDLLESQSPTQANTYSSTGRYDEEEGENIIINDNDTIIMTEKDFEQDKAISKIFRDGLKDKGRQICDMIKLRQLNFNSPHTLPEIVAQLRQWADKSPLAKWMDITDGNYTTMENPIYVMIIDDLSSGQIVSAKQSVVIVAGIQGRDHHAVAAAMYILYQLIERSEAHSELLAKYRFWIIPVFNPDGYDYSMTFPHRREWTKNLRQAWEPCPPGRESCKYCETHGLRCTIQPCYGVNLDRNFEYQWIPTEELRADHPCGSLYAGPRQVSEAETRALTQFLHNSGAPIHNFIALKEGSVLAILYPYSHTRKKRAFDYKYRLKAARAAAAAFEISGRKYVAGQVSDFLPLYAGGIEDWVDGHLGIDNTYTIMLFRQTDSYQMQHITERVVHEAFAAMDTLLQDSSEHIEPTFRTVAGFANKISIFPKLILFSTMAGFLCK